MNFGNIINVAGAASAVFLAGAFAEAAVEIGKRNSDVFTSAHSQKIPKNLYVVTAGMDSFASDFLIKPFFPQSTIEYISAHANEDKMIVTVNQNATKDEIAGAILSKVKRARERNVEEIVSTIVNQVKARGTLEEVDIAAHGSPGAIYPNGYTSFAISIGDVLANLLAAQKKLNIQIAKRIVFGGCNVFANLSDDDIKLYQKRAHQLNSEIVGATNYYNYLVKAGRMARFTPDGKIDRDKSDRPYSPLVWEAEAESFVSGYSASWMERPVSPQRPTVVSSESHDFKPF